jgi:hypothetical protein
MNGFLQQPDIRDNRYPLSKIVVPQKRTIQSRYHKPGRIMDQGDTPYCCGYAIQQLLQSEPVPQKGKTGEWFYREAKKIDELGPSVSGTSVRAVLNVAKQKQFIESYYWATNTNQIIDYLLRYGPVIAGTPWSSGMEQPNKNGVVKITGTKKGNHAWLIVGVNLITGLFHGVNSYGHNFGMGGQFSITIKDFDTLFEQARQGKSGPCVAAAAIEPGTNLRNK